MFKYILNVLTCFFFLNIFCQTKMNNDNLLYDLSKSKLVWLTQNDSFGVWEIESICYVYQSGTLIDRFIAIGPMLAAKLYSKSNLFYNPEFKYRAVFGNDSVKFFRTHYPFKSSNSKEKINDKFKDLKYNLKGLNSNEALQLDFNELKNLDLNNNIISEINFSYKSFKIRILCKVKNINFDKNSNEFQIEIGEVVFPHIFSDSKNQLLEKSTFAYLAFNKINKVEFILEIINKMTGYMQFEKRFITNAEIKLWSIF